MGWKEEKEWKVELGNTHSVKIDNSNCFVSCQWWERKSCSVSLYLPQARCNFRFCSSSLSLYTPVLEGTVKPRLKYRMQREWQREWKRDEEKDKKIENQTCFYQVDGEASCHLAAVLLKPEVRIRFPWRCLWDVLNELARGIDWMRMCWLGIIGRICVIRMILNIVKTELCLLIALVISTHCLLCFSQPRFIVIATVHSKM